MVMVPPQRLRPVVAALVDVVLRRELGGPHRIDRKAAQHTVDHLLEKLYGMPSFLTPGMQLAAIGMEQLGRLSGGRPFPELSPEQAASLVARIRQLNPPLIINFVDFFDKMGVFIYYCQVEGE
jgi:hypothetical protein